MCTLNLEVKFRPEKGLRFLVSASVASGPARIGIFSSLVFVSYETMSNCSQNCWMNWNSAVLCFKRLFYTGVWTFARFVSLLFSHHTLYIGNYQQRKKRGKNASPHRFWSRSMARNWRFIWPKSLLYFAFWYNCPMYWINRTNNYLWNEYLNGDSAGKDVSIVVRRTARKTSLFPLFG